MNIIGIDPSLISTAMVVNGKLFNYCRKKDAFGKKVYKKWFELCKDFVEYRFIEYRDYDNYSDGEIIKLIDYDNIVNKIIQDIKTNLICGEDVKIQLEGFSYNSKNGDLVDLVTFSTLLRKKLYDEITTDISIISPTSLKLEACKLTYKPINIGKKKEILEYRNIDGISGGKFTKREMLISIMENDFLNDDWSKHLKSVGDLLLNNKKIEKPYEDLVDSFLIYIILKNKYLYDKK